MVLGIATLLATGISFEEYNKGGQNVSFFLESATIAFAIPLYKIRDVLKKYWFQIVGGITLESVVAVYGIYMVSTIMGLGRQVTALMLPLARGIALGTAGHSLGASVAQDMGQVEASMASIALVLVGVIVTVVVPVFGSILM